MQKGRIGFAVASYLARLSRCFEEGGGEGAGVSVCQKKRLENRLRRRIALRSELYLAGYEEVWLCVQ